MDRAIRLAIFASFAVFAFGTFASLRFEDNSPSEPTLRLLRFAPDDRFLMAVTRFTNHTTQPIFFYGHQPEVPMQSLESHSAAGWQDCGCRWCGSGAATHELKPGESIELRTPVGMLDPTENEDMPAYRRIDPTLLLRVRTHYGFDGERAITPVWSNEFRHPQRDIAHSLTSSEPREP